MMIFQFLPLSCYGHNTIEMTQSYVMLVHRMIVYNKLSWTIDNEIIKYDDLFIAENFEPQEKVVVDNKVGDGVMVEDESLKLDDCSIEHGAD
jgi:hypothetical protein